MEFSDYYTRRQECMAKLDVPTISEITEVLGEPLSEIFFDQCPEPLKPLVGLSPPLEGAGDDLWISPSDILIGKVCLKPPLTNKHMKALTHQGILEIGRDIEIKYWNEMEIEKQKCLDEQAELLKFMFDKEKREIVKVAIEEEQQICNCIIENLKSDFEEKLQIELAELEARMTADFDKIFQEQRGELDREWQEKLDEAVRGTVTTLTENFLKDLQKQTEELMCHYESLMKKEQIKCQYTLETERTRYKDILKQLKHYLECKNIANMMYVLCMERRKCEAEREAMESLYQKEIEELHEQLKEKEITTRKQEIEAEEEHKRLEIREQCVLEILRQFQKFINFALRASPTQAEFLLSVERMMLFELTSAVINTEAKKVKSQASTILAWKTPSLSSSVAEQESLTVPDHHDCLNADDQLSEHTLTSGDALPALYYNKHMYVREDFRNMFSQGLELTRDNMLWNKDVENLMQILRSTVKGDDAGEGEEKVDTHSVVTDEGSGSLRRFGKTPLSNRSQRRSSVHFSIISQDVIPTLSDIRVPAASKSSIRRTSSKYTDEEMINLAAIGREEKRKTLIATRNSLELLKEHFNTVTDEAESEIKEQDEECSQENEQGSPTPSMIEAMKVKILDSQARDSLTKHRKSLKVHSLSDSDAELSGGSFKPDAHRRVSIAKDELFIPNEKLFESVSLDASVMDEIIRDAMPVVDEISPKLSLTTTPHANTSFTESKLTLARDSMIIHKESLMHKTMSMMSKLSVLRDSLEILQERRASRVDGSFVIKSPTRKASVLKRRESKLSMARDSVEMLKGSMGALPHHAYQAASKLSMHRDSLELIKASRSSKDIYTSKNDKMLSKESVEVLDGIISNSEAERKPSSVIKLDDDGAKMVKMSHIEVVQIEKAANHSGVSFNPQAIVLEDEGLVVTGSPHQIYVASEEEESDKGKQPKKPKRDNFLKKPNEIKVVGDRKAEEHLQKDDEFTIHRVNSLLSIFKKHPSLIKMFTSATH